MDHIPMKALKMSFCWGVQLCMAEKRACMEQLLMLICGVKLYLQQNKGNKN